MSTSSDLEQALGEMPGVQQVFVSTGKTITVEVVLIENASAEQAAAVVRTFRNRTAEPGFRWREPQIEVRRGVDPSFFRVGRQGLDSAAERVVQWIALRDAFPTDEVRWTNHTMAVGRRAGSGYLGEPPMSNRDVGVGNISLNLLRTNDFRAVSAAYRRLGREFTALSGARWRIGSATGTGATLSMGGRYPTEAELSVWQRLNEDQQPPHLVFMRMSVWDQFPLFSVAEKPESDRREDAELLAEKHLPIAAELGTFMYYSATTDIDEWSRSDVPFAQEKTGPLHITILGCTRRGYTPGAVEQKLADRYERC
ncbi:hypothetical protein [Nocardia brasiliensis]|uniref:hypothetical protein n=1 Tax=Nocardia brasiliensis TaxID=37326 RepID=UPI003D8E6A97